MGVDSGISGGGSFSEGNAYMYMFVLTINVCRLI